MDWLKKIKVQWNYCRARWWWHYRTTPSQREMLRPVVSREHPRRPPSC